MGVIWRALLCKRKRANQDFKRGIPVSSNHSENRQSTTAALLPAVDVVIMAAGKGTRMKSRLPKVLQQLAHKPLLQHVLATAEQLHARSAVVITGHGADAVEAALSKASSALPLKFVRQEPQLGTGHAVQQAAPVLPDDGVVVVLSGDVPLTQAETLQALIALRRTAFGAAYLGYA
jgi:bifunctional UDP-N-acetylglucosamine pyrophosphorylase/glucosamine-1-phosphate N-acetyltransferase